MSKPKNQRDKTRIRQSGQAVQPKQLGLCTVPAEPYRAGLEAEWVQKVQAWFSKVGWPETVVYRLGEIPAA
jgi:hypothetical protein